MQKIKRLIPYTGISSLRKHQEGKMGYFLLWLLGIPIPILFMIFLMRGCD